MTSPRKSPARQGSRNGADNLKSTDRLADSNERFNLNSLTEIELLLSEDQRRERETDKLVEELRSQNFEREGARP